MKTLRANVAKLRAGQERARADWEQERSRWAAENEVDLSAVSQAPLLSLLREDFDKHYRSLAHPGLHALWVYRVGHWGRFQPDPLRRLVKVGHRLANKLVIQNVYGAEIDDDAVIGRGVLLAHQQGVQITGYTVIGDGCVIRHNVTLGLGDDDQPATSVPSVGRGVQLGTGASLLGRIRVGDHAKIGPHALVMKDVPDGATAFGPTARILRTDQPPK